MGWQKRQLTRTTRAYGQPIGSQDRPATCVRTALMAVTSSRLQIRGIALVARLGQCMRDDKNERSEKHDKRPHPIRYQVRHDALPHG